MGISQAIFGGGVSKEKLKNLLIAGAVIIDVRSVGEYQRGHAAGSKNIPLPEISKRVSEIKKINKPLILCCASGNRSGQAESILKREGIECINGGSWYSVNASI